MKLVLFLCVPLLSALHDKSYVCAFTAHIRFAYIRCQTFTETYIRFTRLVVQPFGVSTYYGVC